MQKVIFVLAALALLMSGRSSGVTAQAGVLDFTLGDSSENAVALPGTYQPLPGITVTYTNVSTYNAVADHTSGLAGTDNYFVFPSTGNQGVMTFAFNSTVSIPSFYYDNFHATGDILVHAYDASNTELTPAGGLLLPSPSHADGQPVFAQSLGLASYSTIRTVTFTNVNSNDAVNIDDITVRATPEPSSFILCGLGAVGLFIAARRQRKA